MQDVRQDTTAGSHTPEEAAASSRAIWRQEIIDTWRIAMPMATSQLGQVAMMTTDLALIGQLGGEALAAAALAHTVLFGFFVVGLGLVAAVAPLAAQAYGARQPRMIRRSLRVGVWAAVAAGIPLSLLQMRGADILVALGQDATTSVRAGEYLVTLAWSLTPSWIFIAQRNFMSALHRPEPALWITLAAIPLNALIAYALISGAFGMPMLGISGAGLATTLVNIGMCAAAFVVCLRMRPFKKYHVLGGMLRLDWQLLSRLVLLGLPISGAFALEYGLFAGAALLMGRLGTPEIAAHQIAFQVASIVFMVPLGISMAVTVRVGHAYGRKDTAAMRRAGFMAIALAAIYEAAMTLIIALGRHQIPALFLDVNDPANAATVNLATVLLLVGTTFFIADGMQTVAAGALRGLNDTRVPLLYAAVSFWLVGFTSACALGFVASLGAIGIWIGLTLGLMTFMLLLVTRFERLTRPDRGATSAPHTTRAPPT